MAISKSEARRLVKNGMEMGAQVWRGIIRINESTGEITIGDKNLLDELARYAGAEVVLVAAPIEKIAIESELKTCLTCGRDYTGDSCPHCAQVRARLRG